MLARLTHLRAHVPTINSLCPASAVVQISAQPGESIYKGHRSYDLMLNLQLGIRFSVGSITSKPVPNQLSDSDFRRTVSRWNRPQGA